MPMVRLLRPPSDRKRLAWSLGRIRPRNWRLGIRFIETFSRSFNQSIIGCIGSSAHRSRTRPRKLFVPRCGKIASFDRREKSTLRTNQSPRADFEDDDEYDWAASL